MKFVLFLVLLLYCIFSICKSNNEPNPFSINNNDVEYNLQKNTKYEDLFLDVHKLAKIDESILINELNNNISKDMEEAILKRLCFVHSLNQYPFLMERISKYDPQEYKSLHACFCGSLVGAPQSYQYDIYLRENALKHISNHSNKQFLYDNFIIVLGFRKSQYNNATLNYLSHFQNLEEGMKSDFLKDALEFYDLQPCELDLSKIKNINKDKNKDKINIIEEIFNHGIPGLRDMSIKNGFLIRDIYLNGYWKKNENKWKFHPGSADKDENSSISYDLDIEYNEKNNNVFVQFRIWAGNMNWKAFILRFEKKNELLQLTGFWFIALG